MVYLSDSPAGALLERLVHLEVDSVDDLPPDYLLLQVTVPSEVRVRSYDLSNLPKSWQQRVRVTRAVGNAWLRSGETALLKVPSALVPQTHNYLLNPEHNHARRVRIVGINRHPFDTRLVKLVRR